MKARKYDLITFDCYGTLKSNPGSRPPGTKATGKCCGKPRRGSPRGSGGPSPTGERRWLHAAQSYFHDVVPARELGIPVAWINRKAETVSGDTRPDRELRTMEELADWLT